MTTRSATPAANSKLAKSCRNPWNLWESTCACTHAGEVHVRLPRLEHHPGSASEDEASRLAIGVVGSLPLSPSDQTRLELPRPALAQHFDDEARHDYPPLGLRLESLADE